MRVLVTNDDGIGAPGLAALVSGLAAAGHEVLVAAPARQYSGAGGAILVDDEAEQVLIEQRHVPGAAVAWAVGAAPAMCVLLALRGSFGPMPEVVVSGINYGANTGRVLLHSGTVGAALTAGLAGVSALACSLDVGQEDGRLHWAAAASTVARVLPVLEQEPRGTVLNVNVPNTSGPHVLAEAPLDARGVVHTSASDADTDDASVRLALATGRDRQSGSDLDLLARGLATVTSVVPPSAVPLTAALPDRPGGTVR